MTGARPYTAETVNGDRFLELCARVERHEIEFDGNLIVVGLANYRVAWRPKINPPAEQILFDSTQAG